MSKKSCNTLLEQIMTIGCVLPFICEPASYALLGYRILFKYQPRALRKLNHDFLARCADVDEITRKSHKTTNNIHGNGSAMKEIIYSVSNIKGVGGGGLGPMLGFVGWSPGLTCRHKKRKVHRVISGLDVLVQSGGAWGWQPPHDYLPMAWNPPATRGFLAPGGALVPHRLRPAACVCVCVCCWVGAQVCGCVGPAPIHNSGVGGTLPPYGAWHGKDPTPDSKSTRLATVPTRCAHMPLSTPPK